MNKIEKKIEELLQEKTNNEQLEIACSKAGRINLTTDDILELPMMKYFLLKTFSKWLREELKQSDARIDELTK